MARIDLRQRSNRMHKWIRGACLVVVLGILGCFLFLEVVFAPRYEKWSQSAPHASETAIVLHEQVPLSIDSDYFVFLQSQSQIISLGQRYPTDGQRLHRVFWSNDGTLLIVETLSSGDQKPSGDAGYDIPKRQALLKAQIPTALKAHGGVGIVVFEEGKTLGHEVGYFEGSRLRNAFANETVQ